MAPAQYAADASRDNAHLHVSPALRRPAARDPEFPVLMAFQAAGTPHAGYTHRGDGARFLRHTLAALRQETHGVTGSAAAFGLCGLLCGPHRGNGFSL